MKPDQIKPNNHSVCIKYAVSGLNVDVVPVQYKGDADDRGYLFAVSGGEPFNFPGKAAEPILCLTLCRAPYHRQRRIKGERC